MLLIKKSLVEKVLGEKFQATEALTPENSPSPIGTFITIANLEGGFTFTRSTTKTGAKLFWLAGKDPRIVKAILGRIRAGTSSPAVISIPEPKRVSHDTVSHEPEGTIVRVAHGTMNPYRSSGEDC